MLDHYHLHRIGMAAMFLIVLAVGNFARIATIGVDRTEKKLSDESSSTDYATPEGETYSQPVLGIHPYTTQNNKVPRILHTVWGRPKLDQRGYANVERVMDVDSFSGCCDSLLELALKSYQATLPKDFKIYFWNLGGFDNTKFLDHIGLGNSNVVPLDFDVRAELADDPKLVTVWDGFSHIVSRADFARYVVLRNYGGSYVDLDGIMVRDLPYDGVPRINISPTRAKDKNQNCEGFEEGTCILSNNMFVGFPANHTVFRELLGTISAENRTCGGNQYFCIGPGWMSTTLRKVGIPDVASIGVRPEPLLRNKGAYKRETNVLVSHWDVDFGDIKCDSEKTMTELCQKYNVSTSNVLFSPA